MSTPRLAINPIAYWFRDGKIDRSREVLEQAFRDFQLLGYRAVKADVPAGMSTGEYLEWLDSFGLSPSVSLFNSALDETVDMRVEIERATTFGAQQAALGLDRTMVSSVMIAARYRTPGIGADYSAARFERCVENLRLVCEALQAEGIHALLHNHVGGVFETVDEVEDVLAAIPADLLGFGPDTGHLAWAGGDPVAVVARHGARMGAIHLKDAFSDFLDPQRRVGHSYAELQATKRLWTEPGDGVVDLAGVLAAMPADYDGDYMIEVDEPSIDDRFESSRRSFEWAARSLPPVVVQPR